MLSSNVTHAGTVDAMGAYRAMAAERYREHKERERVLQLEENKANVEKTRADQHEAFREWQLKSLTQHHGLDAKVAENMLWSPEDAEELMMLPCANLTDEEINEIGAGYLVKVETSNGTILGFDIRFLKHEAQLQNRERPVVIVRSKDTPPEDAKTEAIGSRDWQRIVTRAQIVETTLNASVKPLSSYSRVVVSTHDTIAKALDGMTESDTESLDVASCMFFSAFASSEVDASFTHASFGAFYVGLPPEIWRCDVVQKELERPGGERFIVVEICSMRSNQFVPLYLVASNPAVQAPAGYISLHPALVKKMKWEETEPVQVRIVKVSRVRSPPSTGLKLSLFGGEQCTEDALRLALEHHKVIAVGDIVWAHRSSSNRFLGSGAYKVLKVWTPDGPAQTAVLVDQDVAIDIANGGENVQVSAHDAINDYASGHR